MVNFHNKFFRVLKKGDFFHGIVANIPTLRYVKNSPVDESNQQFSTAGEEQGKGNPPNQSRGDLGLNHRD